MFILLVNNEVTTQGTSQNEDHVEVMKGIVKMCKKIMQLHHKVMKLQWLALKYFFIL